MDGARGWAKKRWVLPVEAEYGAAVFTHMELKARPPQSCGMEGRRHPRHAGGMSALSGGLAGPVGAS
jgi:hypothetical protein